MTADYLTAEDIAGAIAELASIIGYPDADMALAAADPSGMDDYNDLDGAAARSKYRDGDAGYEDSLQLAAAGPDTDGGYVPGTTADEEVSRYLALSGGPAISTISPGMEPMSSALSEALAGNGANGWMFAIPDVTTVEGEADREGKRLWQKHRDYYHRARQEPVPSDESPEDAVARITRSHPALFARSAPRVHGDGAGHDSGNRSHPPGEAGNHGESSWGQRGKTLAR